MHAHLKGRHEGNLDYQKQHACNFQLKLVALSIEGMRLRKMYPRDNNIM